MRQRYAGTRYHARRIDAVLNHKESKGVTKIYQRYDYSKEAADAWAKWGRHLAGLRATATGDNVVMITG
jgi:hypothetical protein